VQEYLARRRYDKCLRHRRAPDAGKPIALTSHGVVRRYGVRLPRFEVVKSLAGLRLADAGFFRFDIFPLAVRVAIHAAYARLGSFAILASHRHQLRPSTSAACLLRFISGRTAGFLPLRTGRR
jgi:hypothetical protein